jgi:hypothetical protein
LPFNTLPGLTLGEHSNGAELIQSRLKNLNLNTERLPRVFVATYDEHPNWRAAGSVLACARDPFGEARVSAMRGACCHYIVGLPLTVRMLYSCTWLAATSREYNIRDSRHFVHWSLGGLKQPISW